MALLPVLLFACVILVVSVAQANKTEVHIGVQANSLYYDEEFMQAWTRHIVSYINEKALIRNYTLVPDFLNEQSINVSLLHDMYTILSHDKLFEKYVLSGLAELMNLTP